MITGSAGSSSKGRRFVSLSLVGNDTILRDRWMCCDRRRAKQKSSVRISTQLLETYQLCHCVHRSYWPGRTHIEQYRLSIGPPHRLSCQGQPNYETDSQTVLGCLRWPSHSKHLSCDDYEPKLLSQLNHRVAVSDPSLRVRTDARYRGLQSSLQFSRREGDESVEIQLMNYDACDNGYRDIDEDLQTSDYITGTPCGMKDSVCRLIPLTRFVSKLYTTLGTTDFQASSSSSSSLNVTYHCVYSFALETPLQAPVLFIANAFVIDSSRDFELLGSAPYMKKLDLK